MLSIKKTFHGNFVLFDTRDFSNHHTHTKSLRVAKIIRHNIIANQLPKSKDIRMLESHLRVATDFKYREELLKLIDEVSNMHTQKAMNLKNIELIRRDITHSTVMTDIEKSDHMKLCNIFMRICEIGYYQPTKFSINRGELCIQYHYRRKRVSVTTLGEVFNLEYFETPRSKIKYTINTIDELIAITQRLLEKKEGVSFESVNER